MELGSETGIIQTREAFSTVGSQKSNSSNPNTPEIQPHSPNFNALRFTYPSDGALSIHSKRAGEGHPNMDMGESVKRKRGRPRKYGPNGTMTLALGNSPSPLTTSPMPPSSGSSVGGFNSPAPNSGSSFVMKKARGRPLGSGKKQKMNSVGSAGTGFIPHVINVQTGEDVSSKIMSFLQLGSRTVCIMSANGAISNVTLRQAATSGGTVTYEGRFEILSLSGSFFHSEIAGQHSRIGGLSVSLAGPDGRVLGGGVAGILTAASPVQVMVGSFLSNGVKKDPKTTALPLTPISSVAAETKRPVIPNMVTNSSMNGAHSVSESSDGNGSSPNQNTGGVCNNGNQHGIPIIPWK